jgi:hypothetical protein
MQRSGKQSFASFPKPRYLRFRTTLKEAGVSGPLGVFRAVGLLSEWDVLDHTTAHKVETICGWFNKNLPVPVLPSEHWRAVFWFRSESGAMVNRLWELARLIREQGFPIEFVTTMDPGTICYADRLQIAAIPRSGSRLRSL